LLLLLLLGRRWFGSKDDRSWLGSLGLRLRSIFCLLLLLLSSSFGR